MADPLTTTDTDAEHAAPLGQLSRRRFVEVATTAAVGIPALSFLAGCSSSGGSTSAGTSAAAVGGQASAGGSSAAAPSTGGSAAKLSADSIKVVKSHVSDPSFIPDAVALELLKSKHGVTTKQSTLTGSNTAITALIAGQVDIVVSSIVSPIEAIEQGQKIVAVFPGDVTPPHALIVNEKIKSWNDVPGSVWGATSKTDSSYWEVELECQKNGIDVKSLKIVTVKGTAARADALVAGKIDGGFISTGHAVKLLAKHKNLRVLALPGEDFPKMIYDAYFVRRNYLDDHADVVQAYAQAEQEAHRQMQDQSAYLAAVNRILGTDYTDQEVKLAFTQLQRTKSWNPTEDSWNSSSGTFTTNKLASLGILPKPIKFADWATTTYVDAARSALGPFSK